MTKNAIQPAEFSSLSLNLTACEYEFLYWLLSGYDRLLCDARHVLGFHDLLDRSVILSDLMRRNPLSPCLPQLLSDNSSVIPFSIETPAEEYEVHVALEGAHIIMAGDKEYGSDDVVALVASVRDKLNAAESSAPSASFSVQAVQQALPFFAEAAPVESSPAASESELVGIDPPSPSVFDADAEAEAEAAGMPPLVPWNDFKKLDFRKLGARLDENTFRSERLGAIVDILKGVPASGAAKGEYAGVASVDDVLEAAHKLRLECEQLGRKYLQLCDDYEDAVRSLSDAADLISAFVEENTALKKRSTTRRRRATGHTGRWYEALEVSHD